MQLFNQDGALQKAALPTVSEHVLKMLSLSEYQAPHRGAAVWLPDKAILPGFIKRQVIVHVPKLLLLFSAGLSLNTGLGAIS